MPVALAWPCRKRVVWRDAHGSDPSDDPHGQVDRPGQAATSEVIAAWTEAYDFLADTLMAREGEIYDQRVRVPGGWAGWREFGVDRIIPESETIKSFYLRARDAGPLMAFRPGQYLTVRLDVPGFGPVIRNYSVSSAPGRDYYRISVKREGPPEEAPYAPPDLASSYLHEEARPGTVVQVSPPGGDFFLDEGNGRPLALLSGGVGMTPTISMLEHLVDRRVPRETWYVHAAPCGRQHAMKRYVRDIAAAAEGRPPDRRRRLLLLRGPAASCACSPSAYAPSMCPRSASTSSSSVPRRRCTPDHVGVASSPPAFCDPGRHRNV